MAGKRGKRKSKPTTKARSRKQNTRDRYAHAREDAQLEGLIETTPEEALRSERVDPSTQGEQNLTSLVRVAVRKGWQVPEEKKPVLVDEMVAVMEDEEESSLTKVFTFNALVKADHLQWERDNPVESGKSKGGVQVRQEIDLKQLFQQVDRQRNGTVIGLEEVPDKDGCESNGRHDDRDASGNGESGE